MAISNDFTPQDARRVIQMMIEKECEIERLTEELNHLKQKVSHGCTDALCDECDNPMKGKR